MKRNKLYVVARQYTMCGVTVLGIGYLPFHELPESLREVVVSGQETLFLDSGGLRGIYEKKKLAEVHLRAEKAWRCSKDKFWIVTINPK